MVTQQLSTRIQAGGLRSPNFFNGRLLTGEDLTAEHEANHRARDWLGQAVGEGVVSGLQVDVGVGSTPAAPVVTVTAGLALNRAGHALFLDTQVDLSLVQSSASTAATGSAQGGSFVDCKPPQAGVYVTGAGVYLLVLAPASGTEGRAQVSGLGNVDATCNSRSLVDGVQFRLIQLQIAASDLSDAARLRNRVAYQCLGAADPRLVNFTLAPFTNAATRYGLLDDLRSETLTDCDVPLALIYWTAQAGIGFVDLWSVRRRVYHAPITARWPLLIGDRRLAEHEAAFLQFQAHLATLLMTLSEPRSARAVDNFAYLPPVGFVPLAQVGGPPGFEQATFFTNISCRSPVAIEGAGVESLVRRAIDLPPIDLHASPAAILYFVRENQDTRLPHGAPYLIFTSPHVPYVGAARYDVTHWEYGRYERDPQPGGQ